MVEKKNVEIRNVGKDLAENQENLRLSTTQGNKLKAELNEYRNRLDSVGG